MTTSNTSKQIEFASKMKNIEISDLVYEYIENRLLNNDLSIEVAVKIAQMTRILDLNDEDALEDHYKKLLDLVIED
ncbi:TPA: hypothetical protein ACN30S_004526 [Vibrio campbellii]